MPSVICFQERYFLICANSNSAHIIYTIYEYMRISRIYLLRYNIASVKCCFYPKWKLVEFLSLSQNLIPIITFKDPIVVMPWSINTAIPALAATHAPIAVLLTNPATSAERCACERVYLNKCDSCAVHEFAWECFQVDGNNHSTRSECIIYICTVYFIVNWDECSRGFTNTSANHGACYNLTLLDAPVTQHHAPWRGQLQSHSWVGKSF